MKKIVLLGLLFVVSECFSQLAPPQAFSYSAVARNGGGTPLYNQSIGIQFSILKSSTVGAIQYQENHFTTTNQFGVFTLSLGTGSVQQGNFNNINWGNDSYYLKVGLDATGGTNFQNMGVTQFLSVPYAHYAANAGNRSDNDTSATNEIQTLSIIGDSLSISYGNKIKLPRISDGDTSSTNEIQTLSLTNDTLLISGGNRIKLPRIFDGDTSSTNELQTLSLSTDTLKISGRNNLLLPFNFQMNFTVKINDLSISDPSINHVMIAPYAFLTATNYRYDLEFFTGSMRLSDSTGLISSTLGGIEILSTNNTCSGQLYVEKKYGGASPGRIFNFQGSVYYVPLNASPVNINFQSVDCTAFSGSTSCYPIFPNNPSITGYSLPSRIKVSYSRK